MELFGISADMLIDYTMFGIVCNFTAAVIVFFASMIKASTMTETEFVEFKKFGITRRAMMARHSQWKQLASSALVLLPFYTVMISAIYMWHLVTKPRLWGLISAVVKSDNFAIIRLVHYEFVDLSDK